MAGSLSDYLEDKLLDHVLKNTSYDQPTNLYVALWIGDPTDIGTGGAEVSGGSYARVQCNTWDGAASRATANTGAIEFAEATADWGTVTHFAIWDDISAGNMIAHGSLTASKAIGTGDNASFAIGDIDISFNAGGITDLLANKLLDHVFKNTAYTQATNLYIALFTSSPTDTGEAGTEVTGGSYARDPNDTWDGASSGASQNTAAIEFITATAAWGTVTHFTVSDHLSTLAAHQLLWGTLDTSKAIGNGDTAKYDIGALDITLD